MSDIDANHVGVLLEHIASQNQAVLEAVGDMQKKVAVLPRIEQRLEALEQDMKIVKAAVVDAVFDNERGGLPTGCATS